MYHNDTLYSFIEEILSTLVNLLNDSVAKTRFHSTGKNHNITIESYDSFRGLNGLLLKRIKYVLPKS